MVVLRSDKQACATRQRTRAKRAVNPGRNLGLAIGKKKTETAEMRVRRKGQSNILNKESKVTFSISYVACLVDALHCLSSVSCLDLLASIPFSTRISRKILESSDRSEAATLHRRLY
jgi:hypothetical protein